MARLTYRVGDDERVVELDPNNAVRIGRDEACTIPLPDVRGVSRRHCQLMALPHQGRTIWELTDLGATNKTHVNGKAADRKVLSSGDTVQVGECEFTFHDEDEEKQLREAGSKGVCYLEWVTGGQKGAKVWLDKPRVTLGRRESSTIPLDDRMASGHHAEITKDLNGFTIRDMGSTNGTLVNGEPTTEAPLNHGTRVRIGNSRFVFKDPSMKDIEVELSQFDDDDGWGMMGDIDLSKARGSYGGLLAGLLLLGLVGAGAYFFLNAKQKTSTAGIAADTLVTNHNFDDAENLLWSEEGGGDEVGVVIRGKGKSSALHVTGSSAADEGTAVSSRIVVYDESFAALDQPLHIVAKSRSTSPDSGLVGIWRSGAASATSLSRTVMLQPSSGESVDVTLSRPTWADSFTLGVLVGPDQSVTIDNVLIDYDGEASAKTIELECAGDPSAHLGSDGTIDILNSAVVMAAGCQPVAVHENGDMLTRFAIDGAPTKSGEAVTVRGTLSGGEATVPVTMKIDSTSDGLRLSLEGKGAKAIGLRIHQPLANLSAGVHVLTTSGPRTLGAESGSKAESVRKTLAGEPKATAQSPVTLVTVASVAAEGEETTATTLSISDTLDASMLAISNLAPGSNATLDVVTNYRAQDAKARKAYDDAKLVLATQPIVGIARMRAVAQEYPFAESVRDSALKDAATTEKKVRQQVSEFKESLHRFRIFQSEESLTELSTLEEALRSSVAGLTPDQGAVVADVQELLKATATAKADHYRRNAGLELSRLERFANVLKGTDGYRPMAALLFQTIQSRFATLGDDESFRARMEAAKASLKELKSDPTVNTALPPSAEGE